MSNSPRELPGFYYDTERGKYFPLTQQRQNQFKKQKLDSQLQNQNINYWNECFREYCKFVEGPRIENIPFTDGDLFVIYNIMTLKKRGADLFNELLIRPIDLTLGSYQNKLLHSFSFNGGNLYWNILSDGRILEYEKDNYHGRWDTKTSEHNITEIDNFDFNPRFEEFTIVNIKRAQNSRFIHYKIKQKRTISATNSLLSPSTQHLFHKIFTSRNPNENGNPDLKCFTKLDERDFDNINDTIATSYGPLLAVKRKIFLLNWTDTNIQTTLKFTTQSDITTLGSQEENDSCCYVFCGTRNGYIYKLLLSKKLSVEIPRVRIMKCYKNICKVSSIVSITVLSGYRILVSGFTQDVQSQYLFIIDLLEMDSNDEYTTATPTILVTKFKNATKETELLSISDDEQYICYGKQNDFEIFSLRHRSYEQNGNYTCYPYASSFDFLKNCSPNWLTGFRLSNVSFSNNVSTCENHASNYFKRSTFTSTDQTSKIDSKSSSRDGGSLIILMSFQSSAKNNPDSSLPTNKLLSAYIF
ncbi:similar to Saccharomyces cerevisiae YGL176C Putative protein of unknown function [Maudiozyma saulgeensis]|uniref:Uncharacterized protein n=1 Tax=Maudiozyma saulgeensis TaxID=1789683 RepID=A0A1X7QZU2_9SACH|nr:similar to Saccharomyces cerevisiae YGL176C Putative protein of unknown function [Kazachstania saulgeensis]